MVSSLVTVPPDGLRVYQRPVLSTAPPYRRTSRPRTAGINAIDVVEGDKLLAVRVTDGDHHVLLATASGYSIRFHEDDVRPMGRVARGVKGIALRSDDRVVSMEVLEDEGAILTVSERGYGKRTDVAEYRLQGRGGKGILNLKLSDKTGPVVGVRQVVPGQEVVLITQEGKIIRTSVDDIRVIGRATQGVRVMHLSDEDRLVALAKVVEREEDADAGAAAQEPDAAGAAEAAEDAEPPEEPVN